MIDIRQLRYFVTLTETLHFGRAAERLRVTQPPLSRQIQALEKDLGVRLLERNSRNTVLTSAGKRFGEDAKAVLIAFEQACRSAQLTDSGEMGELRIGFMMHAAHSSVPPLARRFISDYPQVRLHLRETFPMDLIDGVLGGSLDAGIGFRLDDQRGLASQTIHEEPLCLAVPQQHALAVAVEVGAEALANEPLITAPEEVAPTLRQAIKGYLLTAGLAPEIRLESQLQQSIVSLVAEGLGVALVPASLRRLSVPEVAFIALKDAPMIEQVLYWRPTNLNPALPHFLKSLAPSVPA